MIKIKISADEPIVFFIRVKGPKGVREFRAILDTGSTYSTIPLQDARELGYDAYYDDYDSLMPFERREETYYDDDYSLMPYERYRSRPRRY